MESRDSQLLAASRESRRKKKKEQESKESNVCSRADLSLSFLRKYVVYITHDSVASNSSLHLNSQIILRVHFFHPFIIRYLRPKTISCARSRPENRPPRFARGIIFSVISRSMRDTRSMNYNVVEELMPIIAKINGQTSLSLKKQICRIS